MPFKCHSVGHRCNSLSGRGLYPLGKSTTEDSEKRRRRSIRNAGTIKRTTHFSRPVSVSLSGFKNWFCLDCPRLLGCASRKVLSRVFHGTRQAKINDDRQTNEPSSEIIVKSTKIKFLHILAAARDYLYRKLILIYIWIFIGYLNMYIHVTLYLCVRKICFIFSERIKD